jgi:hypothetical protein
LDAASRATCNPNILAVRRNVSVSADDAVSLLSAWKMRSRWILGSLTTDGIVVSFGGVLTEVTSTRVVITQFGSTGAPKTEFAFQLAAAIQIDHHSLEGAASGSPESLLVLEFPHAVCRLNEIAVA